MPGGAESYAKTIRKGILPRSVTKAIRNTLGLQNSAFDGPSPHEVEVK